MIKAKRDLADRLRQVRAIRYGEEGGPLLARLLDIPPRSWANFENGVTIPGEVLLAFIVLTDAEPRWLLHGEGGRFRLIASGPALEPVGDASQGPS